MKYTPVERQENANISQTHPLKELFLLLGGVLGLLIMIYIVLGVAVDLIVPHLPAGFERGLGQLYAGAFEGQANREAESYLQGVLDHLIEQSSQLDKGPYNIHIVPSNQANALALPGGHIVILSALLAEMESENELAFILAHELGHFANRDHLKGLGRGLVLTAISSMLFGVDNTLTNFLMKSLMTVDMRFSQQQETKADVFALNLVNKHYGHVSGATDFFETLSRNDSRGRLTYFFATHPYPLDRVARMQEEIQRREYASGEKLPLDDSLQQLPEPQETEKPSVKDILDQ